jgi:hypothetical protein
MFGTNERNSYEFLLVTSEREKDMGKILRILLIIVILPFEILSAVLKAINSAVRMMVSIWDGDNYFDAVLKEMNRRIDLLKAELERTKDLATKLRGDK